MSMTSLQIFADGADLAGIRKYAAMADIKGFTTNPTLMRKAGVEDYETFAHEALTIVGDRPISFEVFSDEADEMFAQAVLISSWGKNVFVKIPVTNTKGVSSAPLLKRLVAAGVQVNVTAMFTLEQVKEVLPILASGPKAYLSIFAGRIADTGCDPLPVMKDALALMAPYPQLELIWASPREVFNIAQAEEIGCHVITVTADLLEKRKLFGKDLTQFSLETVQMFYNDAQKSAFTLHT